MATALQEALKDVEEMKKLASSASRKRVQDALAQELRQMEIEVTQLQEAVVAQAADNKAKPTTSPTTFTVNIRNYSWDQSDKFTKLYLTLKNIQNIPKDAITTSFTKKSVEVSVKELEGKNYHLVINNLAGTVNPEASFHKVKTDMLVVLLSKVDQGHKWAGVTAEEVRANESMKPKTDSADPSSNLMDLMKQMYDTGDDKMKQMLNKTWYESQQKNLRGEGMEPSMPELGDM